MKRIIAFLLTLFLVISLMPANVVTAVGTEQTQTQDTTVSDSTPVPESAIVPEEETQTQPVLGAPAGHTHYACSCALEGGNACAGHGTEAAVTYGEWTDGTSLPTEGNWYLAQNVVLTNTAAIEIASGTVNLCLNGFSIQFNAANTAAADIHVASGATLNIVNCQAVLDAKGLFVSGNKANTADLTAGRLYGSRANSADASAVRVEGTFNLIGAEMYDNGVAGSAANTYGGAVLLCNGGEVTALHAKFDSNQARYGGAIANYNGEGVQITLNDTLVTNNSGNSGGASYVKTYDGSTKNTVLTFSGDSLVTGNTSTGSGGAIYATQETTSTKTVQVVLQDNTVVTGNTTGTSSAKGAIAMDFASSYSQTAWLKISGNVQVAGNIALSTTAGAATDINLSNSKNKMDVSKLGPNATVIYKGSLSYLTVPSDNAKKPDDTEATGIFLQNTATQLKYTRAGGFAENADAHKHYNCACVLTGDTTCAHTGAQEVTYQPWFDTTKLPTAGNWYLVYDVGATDTVTLANGETLNLCLNGHSIKFNEENITKANYQVETGTVMNLFNCRAKLDSKGLYEYGNKNDSTDVTAGRLYGGRGKFGGAMLVKGSATVIGVEFYDNQANVGTNAFGGAIRVQQGGVLLTQHAKFNKNSATSYGGAIANYTGNAAITLYDTVFTNNTSSTGGAIYWKSYADATKDAVLTVSGDSVLTGNTASGSGGAIYATKDATAAKTVQVVLQDNVVITGNTTGASSVKGAVAMDCPSAATVAGVLRVSGNVQVKDNVALSTNAAAAKNIYLVNNKNLMEAGIMGTQAAVYVSTGSAYEDPDSFITAVGGVQLAESENIGIFYEKTDPAKTVGYSVADGFYFYTAPAPVVHSHYACSCAIEGGNACAGHGTEAAVTYGEWTDGTSLPTEGNWYLAQNVVLTNTAAIEIASGTVNLCLNGFSITFNEANINDANYQVASGATLNIVNCQAVLDAKGLFVSGKSPNANDASDLSYQTAGRLQGGRGKFGGAMLVKGSATVIGVEFYDNQANVSSNAFGGAIRVQQGGVLLTQHAKFNKNSATSYGGAIANYTGNAAITLYDTVFTNNTSSTGGAVYVKATTAASQDIVLTVSGDSQITGNSSSGSGGAIYATKDATAAKTVQVVLQDNVVITGNTTGASSVKGAVAMDCPSAATVAGVLRVSGNVQVKDNVALSTNAAAAKNIYLVNNKNLMEAGIMGTQAAVYVSTGSTYSDPDSFITAVEGVQLAESENIGIFYEKTDPAKTVGYSVADGFYFYTAPVPATHFHHACSCVIEGGNTCAGHGTEPELGWIAWTDTTKLPTATGNYYLVGDITLTNTKQMEIPNGAKVNLCLNGYSVKFNEAFTSHANYYVQKGSQLTLMNCKAVLDGNGLYVSGNKDDLTDLEAGKLHGGRGMYGGALYIKGNATLIGVELSDNRVSGSADSYGGAIRLQEGGELLLQHCLLKDNSAEKNGGAIAYGKDHAKVTVYSTVITGNTSKSEGGAIAMITDSNTSANSVLTISGNSRIYGNSAEKRGGAIYVLRSNNTKAEFTAELTVCDNAQITGNHAKGNGGGIYFDNTTEVLTALKISGNVVIDGNTTDKNGPNVYLWKNSDMPALTQKIIVGEMGVNAKVGVTTSGIPVDDPDEFLLKADGVTLTDRTKIGIVYENTDPDAHIGYQADAKILFFFSTDATTDHEQHEVCACTITGDPNCKHDAGLKWNAWPFTDKLPTTTGNYYLTKDVVITSTTGGSVGQFEIKDGQKVNLCLNGFSITFSEKNTGKGNYYAMSGSELNFINCKAMLDGNGKFVSGSAGNTKGGQITGGRGMYGGAMYVKGDVTLIGIALRDNQATNKTEGMGGAIRVQDGGKLSLQHCLFENNKANTNGGAICTGRGEAELVIKDSVFTKNTAAVSGGAIALNSAASKLTVTNSLIKDNKAENTGGAIYAKACKMVLDGVTVSNNEAKNAGGIYMQTNSTCTITDTVIEGNIGTTNAGGLYAQSSKVTLGKGAVIRNNEAAAGGGAILQTKAELTFAGGVIENNKGKSGGGMTLWDQSIVYLKDGKIAGNEATKGAGGGIYMQSGSNLNISGGQLTGNKSATYGGGVYANMNDKVKMVEITISGGEISDNEATKNTGGGVYGLSVQFTMTGGAVKNNKANSGGGLYLGSGAAAGDVLGTFTMTGGEISGNQAMYGGGVFHSTNSSASYTGGIVSKNTAETAGGGIFIKKAEVVLDKDFVLSENQSKSGGGLVMQNEAQLDFKGGKIEKNTGSSGGGVMLWSKSELHLNGGLIQNNNSTGSGGGLYMQSGSSLFINSGKITRNTAKGSGGGAFCNSNNADRLTVKITGGEISGNTCEKTGGGIYVGATKAGATLTMWGGSVSGNVSVKETGGGIYVKDADLLLYGGSVSYNECPASGGGVHTNGGKLVLDGATISHNFAGAFGGGIRTYNFTEFEMHSGSVIYNEAENRGGGVALWSSMTMTGGSVSYNAVIGDPDGKDTNTYGGGIAVCDDNSVYVKNHYTLDITDGEFIGNTAINKGGALSVCGECVLKVKDSLFKENKAENMGGAIIADNHKNNRSVPSELYVKNCQFIGNTSKNGGAIYGNWSSETTVEESIFTENSATESGGAIHLRGQSIGWIKTSEFTKNSAGQKGAAIYCDDDAEFEDLTITGNNSGDGYAFYIEEGAFDGLSVVKAITKISGNMKVYDNIGAKPDMFIGKDALVHVGFAGLGKDTKIDLELAQGILTNTLIGAYNYEGGDLKYVVTYGDRSVTDPEPIPVAQPEVEDTTPATEPTATGDAGKQASFSIGGVIAISAVLVVAVIAVLAVVAVKKKKKAEETAKDTVQE